MKNNKSLTWLFLLLLLTVGCVVVQSYDKGYIKINSDKTLEDRKKDGLNTQDVTETVNDNSVKDTSKDKEVSTNINAKNKSTNGYEGNRYKVNPDIRVLINTTGYKSLFHNKVKIKGDGEFEVVTGKKTKRYKSGKTVVFKASDKISKNGKVVIKPCNNTKFKVMSIKRQQGCPKYRGKFEIVWRKEGLLLKNMLPLEKYLYDVIPSEMPTSCNMNALEAQAVCARSFTYTQLNSGRFDKYGADVDDSVSCQVYNNIKEDKKGIKAVDNTKNIVMMTDDNKVVSAYYFATSWGATADGKSVWNTVKPVSYLKGKLQITEKSRSKTGISKMDLSDEKTFRKFIDKNICNTYDSNDDWYRWKVYFKEKNLGKRIDSSLYRCYLSDKENVLTRDKNGKYNKVMLKSIGRLKSIKVEKRDISGLVSEIIIVGSKRTVKVCGQYNVRSVLAPVNEKIKRKKGEDVKGFSLLPSAAFYIDKKKNGRRNYYVVSGGGFGHGTGMSQTGAESMAREGFDYRSILAHYFDGIKTGDISKATF